MIDNTPFQLPVSNRLRWLAHAGECMLGLSQLDNYYRQREQNMNPREFLGYTLERLGIDYHIASGSYSDIPETGPCIVVANHPFGAIEGVMLAELLIKHRNDVKVLANEFLQRIDELSNIFIGVDVFAGTSASRKNSKGIKQAIRHLKNNGLILVFPAGEVSSLQLKPFKITDKKWNRIIGMMIRKTGASTTPIYIEGFNSKLFYIAGLLHPRLRTLLLVREMLNKRRQRVFLHIGQNITGQELLSLPSDEAITSYLRINTYLMAGQAINHSEIRRIRSSDSQINSMQPVAPPIAKHKLQCDIEALPADCLLLQKSELRVFCATARYLPHILEEIGRLREITFRQVAEGTGMKTDLDEYDDQYLHMFIWNCNKQEVAGAYRLGLVDKLIKQKGLNALYSHSLFKYNESFLNSLGNSIEMGRSFIHPDYQRSLNSLLLLWKGIACFASRHPQYTTLFGPVSISSGYSELSRSLMASFLQLHHYDSQRAEMLRARNPYQHTNSAFWSDNMLSDINNNQLISKLIYRMEGDKGLPVLLRQYLGLNGKLVSFNIDKNFNNSLDGMIIVDLLNIPERLLAKYMGKEQAHRYLRR